MPTLKYWVAECLDDDRVYSIRAKTKKDCQRQVPLAEGSYGPPRKVEIFYNDGFDLMHECSRESAFWWEIETPTKEK